MGSSKALARSRVLKLRSYACDEGLLVDKDMGGDQTAMILVEGSLVVFCVNLCQCVFSFFVFVVIFVISFVNVVGRSCRVFVIGL